LPSHHQPLLVLLFQQHELHLIVLQGVIAAWRLLTRRTGAHTSSACHVAGVVVCVQHIAVGTLLLHRRALVLWNRNVGHLFIPHLGTLLLL
jgi:hypothetical protein